MNPDNSHLPSTDQHAANQPTVAGIDQAQAFPSGNDIFVVTPDAPKPLDKKSATLVGVGSLIGIIVLVVVIVFALIGSATGLAGNYRHLALVQVTKLGPALNNLEPSAVLNQRNIDKPLQTITLSDQSQPELENALVVGSLSPGYTQTQTLQKSVHRQYQAIEQYAQDLQNLVAFDDAANAIFNQETNLAATVNPADSLTIRAASGSYQNLASQIKNQTAPGEITDLKSKLVAAFNQKSAIYLAWAKQVEAGNGSYAATAQSNLNAQTTVATKLTDDKNYVTLFKPTYTKLLNDQKLLQTELAG